MQLLEARKHYANLQGSNAPNWNVQKLRKENDALIAKVDAWKKEVDSVKAEYLQLYNSIKPNRLKNKETAESLEKKLDALISKNAKIREQLSPKSSEQNTSVNAKIDIPSTSGSKLIAVTPYPTARFGPKVVKEYAKMEKVSSHSVTKTNEKVVKKDSVLAPGMFRVDLTSKPRENVFVPSKRRSANVKTKPITISQPQIIKKIENNSNGSLLPSPGVESITKTRRPEIKKKSKNASVLSASKSSCLKKKEVEAHPRNLSSLNNQKHVSFECNNIKLAIRNAKSEIVCAKCLKCMISVNHDACVLNYVNDLKSLNAKNDEKNGSRVRLASPSMKSRMILNWLPTGRMFNTDAKTIRPNEKKSKCDNASTSNPSEPKRKRFPNSSLFLGRLSKFVCLSSTRVAPSI